MEKGLTSIARKLRRDGTEVERKLWQRLRARQLSGSKFVRQVPIGPYVADFVCREARLVIELDGGQHATSTTDAARTEAIEAHGYTILRFWNNDVIDNIEGVLEEIARSLRIARNESSLR